MNINKQIREARKNLRKIYTQYAKELYEVTLKIDKYLSTLEQKDEL